MDLVIVGLTLPWLVPCRGSSSPGLLDRSQARAAEWPHPAAVGTARRVGQATRASPKRCAGRIDRTAFEQPDLGG